MSAANESLPVSLTPGQSRPAAGAWMPATLRDDVALAAATAPRDWPRLPGYQIIRELGRGGMGVVYLANETALGRPVALKMILDADQADAHDLTRFKAEAEAVARLQHPNVVQIYAVGQSEGRPYLALEYCAGGSLDSWLEGTPLPPAQAAALLETLARAVQHAHERGILHRDLKPANILLRRKSESPNPKCETRTAGSGSDFGFGISDLEPKVGDFGLAKRLDRPQGPTHSRSILGTPSYMAPEQAQRSPQAADARVDVYALGAILYELVTGRPPFKGESVLDTLQQVVRDEPVSPSHLQPRCPRDLETIILKCLRKDPRQRYATAGELAEDCTAFLKGEPIKARATPPWERAWKWARRRPAAATLAVVLCLTIAGLFGAAVWHTAELQAAVHQARDQEKAALDTAQVSRSRAEAQALLLQAGEAFGRAAWEDARLQAGEALVLLGSRPELADLARRAERLRRDCQRRLAERAAQQDLRQRYRRFLELRDEALFHASLFTGLDLATNLEKTRAAARAALSQFGVGEDGKGPPAVRGPVLGERQQAEVVAGCYELLLVLAEAVAHPLPEQSPATRRECLTAAIRILHGAARLALPPTKAYHLRLARHLDQLGQTAAAAEHRARADALEPASAADYFLVGDERRVRGDLAQACRDFESALALQPNHFWAQYGFAFCCLRLQRLPESKAGLTACLGHRPGFAWLFALRGFIHGELREFRAAEDDFERALAGIDRRPSGGGDTTRYAVFANRGVLRFQQAREAEGLAGLQPAAAWLPLCGVYGSVAEAYRMRKLAEAVNDLRTAVRLKPGNYQARVSLALAYARQNRVGAARQEFDEAIRLMPRLADLYRTRADFAWRLGDVAAARRDLHAALALEPAGSRAADDHVRLGQLLQRERKVEAASRAYDEALRLRPDHAAALRLRAVAMLELRRYPEAVRSLDGYLGRADVGRGVAVAEAYRLRGLTRTQLGDRNGALHDYTRSLGIQPDAATHGYRGWVYLAQEAPKLALADFEMALRLGVRDGDAHAGRGNARVKLGRPGEAVQDAEEALRRGPRTARMLHNTATIFAQAADCVRRDGDARAQGQRFQQRALDLLGDALASLPAARRARFWTEQIQKDPDLASLRGLPRFQQLAPPRQ